jgi:hypothetical protein
MLYYSMGDFMNTGMEERKLTRQIAEIRPCTAADALQRDAIDLQVCDDEELELSPNDRAHHKYFARVKLGAFEDLHLLGLVPRGLRYEAIRTAIVTDDKAALQLAEARVRQNAAHSTCHCDNNDRRTESFSESLRSTVRAIRRDYNPALAHLLSSHYGTEFSWDSTLAISVRGWTSRFVNHALVTVSLFRDITIGRNARLEVDATAIELLARHIWIHRTGTLSHRGGYLRVWANSIQNYLEFSEAVVTELTDSPIWAINKH